MGYEVRGVSPFSRFACLMQARQDQDMIQLRHQGQVIPDGRE